MQKYAIHVNIPNRVTHVVIVACFSFIASQEQSSLHPCKGSIEQHSYGLLFLDSDFML